MLKNKNFTLILFGRVFTNLADSLFLIFLPISLYEKTKNSDILLAVNLLVLVISCLSGLVGPLVDRLNKKAAIIGSQLFQVGVVLLAALFVSGELNSVKIGVIVAALAVFQFANYFSYILQQTYLNLLVAEEDLVKANSYMQIAYTTVNIISDAGAAALLAFLSFRSYISFDIFIYGISILLFLAIKQKNTVKETENARSEEPQDMEAAETAEKISYFRRFARNFQEIFSNGVVRRILIVSFLSQVSWQLLNTYIVAFFVDNDAKQFYPIFSMFLFGGMLSGNALSAKLGNYRNMALLSGVSGILWILYGILSGNVYFILPLNFIAGLFSGLIDPVFTSDMQMELKDKFGSGFSVLMSVNSGGKLLSMPIVYVLYRWFGFSGIFISVGIVFVWITISLVKKEKISYL